MVRFSSECTFQKHFKMSEAWLLLLPSDIFTWKEEEVCKAYLTHKQLVACFQSESRQEGVGRLIFQLNQLIRLRSNLGFGSSAKKIHFRVLRRKQDRRSYYKTTKFIPQTSLMLAIALYTYRIHKLSYVACCLRGDGLMDSILACGAGEPGSIPALSKWFFSWV